MISKDQIRPIYGELIGYLSQLPSYEKQNYLFGSNTIIANQIGKAIDELKEITGEGFDKFRVGVEHGGYGGKTENQISVLELRTKLNGLIMRLYGAYFPDDNPPFGGSPSMIVHQNQNQSQSQVVILLEFQSLIDRKLNDQGITDKERTFLQKLKSILPNIKSATELVSSVISIAKDLGLGIDTLQRLIK